MARFNVETTTIIDPDGVTRRYAVIADRSTFETAATAFGDVTAGAGFVRCKGRQYLGTFGKETPVMAGVEGETYYAPMSHFDGEWRHRPADGRGLHHHVTARSGGGKLFAELEAFAAENNVPYCG